MCREKWGMCQHGTYQRNPDHSGSFSKNSWQVPRLRIPFPGLDDLKELRGPRACMTHALFNKLNEIILVVVG